MTSFGFYISKVRLTGKAAQNAEVQFQDGFNVIFGASNTGKTFISQCIDFAFGRSERPKEIPEARLYEDVHVEIQPRNSNQIIGLRRSLRGGNIAMSVGDEEKVLGVRHSDSDTDNISAVLLGLCGLLGKRVTENARGKTRSLSFRDLTRLVIINEEQIIKSESPIRSSAYTENTVRQSVFRLLLSGVDDSSIVERKERKVLKAEVQGKSEVLERLESEIRQRIEEFKTNESYEDLKARKEKLDSSMRSISGSLTAQRESHKEVETERQQIWTRLQQVESRQEVISQLVVRFSLLSEQYDSDLDRLAAISEVGDRLEQLNEERCPVCGSLAEHHHDDFAIQESSPEVVASAATAEAQKVLELKSDLADTIREVIAERDSLATEKVQLESAFEDVTNKLKAEFRPRVAAALELYQQVSDERATVDEMLQLFQRLEKISTLKAEVETPPPPDPESEVVTIVSTALAEPFCQEVERLLEAWRLPDVGRVTFSEESQDIVIAGRDRSVDGKGVRAITHAAFSIALNNYCVSRSMPTASFVILDSPLVVYRKPDEGEEQFSVDVKASFYRNVATESANRQVIVFENDDPPDDLDESVNSIHFTKSSKGRYGFIPLSTDGNPGDNKEVDA